MKSAMLFFIFAMLLMAMIVIGQEPTDNKNLAPVRKPTVKLERVALVIGNATYQNVSPLQNTIHDAQDIRDTLLQLDFDVIYRENASKSEMESGLTELGEKAIGKEVVFYYSGHGTQIAGHNYLLPINVRTINETTLKVSSVDLEDVLTSMSEAKKKVVILDACRDNPYKTIGRNLGRGLAQVTESPDETLIIYATGPGDIASDNPNGRNGLFTQSLLKYMPKENLEILDCMREVAREVKEQSKNSQKPWSHTSMVEKFYFNPAKSDANTDSIQPPSLTPTGTETVVEVEPEEVVKKMELTTELKINKEGKRTWYEIKVQNLGAAGKIKVKLTFPARLKYKSQEGSIQWPEMEIKNNETKRIPYKGFEAAAPGQFAVECLVQEGTEIRSRVVQAVEIEASLFPSDTPAIVKPPLVTPPVRIDPPLVTPPVRLSPTVTTPSVRITSPFTVIPSAHSYGLPVSIWPACRYEQDGEAILDMTTSTWRNLSWQEQRQHAKTYQTGYAESKGLQVRQVYTVSGVQFQMQLIPPGVYLIGSPSDEVDRSSNESQTRIVISQPFYLGETEVTQAQYEAVTGSNPAFFKGSTLPVETIYWKDAIVFCAGMAQKTGENGWRLPTEYEWEYSCRAGTTTPFNCGPNISPSVVNYDGKYPYNGASKGEYRQRPVPCGSLNNANSWGLSDMHGNVWEWCLDEYGKSYSETVQNANSILLKQVENINSGYRVVRGGSWYCYALRCRSSFRNSFSDRRDYVGYRIFKSLN